MIVHHLPITDGSGYMDACTLSHPTCEPYTLEFDNQSLGHAIFSALDLFECLCQLRHWFARRGFKIICNGARTDTWASTMARQGGAKKVYITRMGQRTTINDLVPTFDETCLDAIGTVEEQASYHKAWLESLR